MAQNPVIVSYPQKIVVVPNTSKVQVIGATPGPKGDPGPPGEEGPPGPLTTLGGLTDVDVSGVSDGDHVYWDLGTGMWLPVDLDDVYVRNDGDTMTDDLTVAVPSGSLTLGTWSAGGYAALEGGRGYILLDHDTNDVMYVRAKTGTLYLGGAASNQIVLDGSTIAFTDTVTGGVFEVNEIRADDGSVADPGFTFKSDENTGMYLQSSDVLAWTTGGVKRALLYSGGFRLNVDGSVTTPAIHWEDDTNTGMYRYGADKIGFSAGGAIRFAIDHDDFIRSYNNHRFADGTQSAPGLTFASDTNTGIRRAGENAIEIVCGANRAIYTTTTATYIPGFWDATVGVGAGNDLQVADANGLVRRQTSSLRYKENVRPFEDVDDILEFQPSWFDAALDGPEKGKTFLSFIAEEAAEVGEHYAVWSVDPELVPEMPEGKHALDFDIPERRPEDINLRAMFAAAVLKIQDLEKRLTQVETKVG